MILDLNKSRKGQLRPDNTPIYYLSSLEFDEYLHDTWGGWKGTESSTTSRVPNGRCMRADREYHGVPLPQGTILVRHEGKGAAKKNRFITGSILVHEIEHAKGGREIEAHLAQRTYDQRNGLKGATNLQLLCSLIMYYKDAEVNRALQVMFPKVRFMHGLLKFYARYLVKPYDRDKDIASSVKW